MVVLDIVLILAAALLFLVGIIGCVVPGLPGVPLCWGGLLVGHFIHCKEPVTFTVLIIAAIVCVIVTIVDFVVPSYFTKKSGGSKAGSTGSMLGVLAGVLTGQMLLIFIGPFIGALIGEIIHDASNMRKAFRSACYSFLGFITGTGLKLVTAGCLLVLFIRSLI
ncbi:MAG: DUF456 domain-containing protein [Treponema sp.]|nr:DUF456 domain-containing protein [Treponema sp.]